MKEINIKKLYPFQYYTIRNVDLLEQNGFTFDDYSFNVKHDHELYIGNINGLCCRHSFGEPDKMMNYLIAGKKLTFLLPENYRECINGLQGFRRTVLRVLDAESLKDQITVITYKVDNSDIIDKVVNLGRSVKFDVCIMNPPYERSLHLKILEKVLTFCDKTVNISPIRWLQDPLAKYKKRSDYCMFENTISKKIDQLYIINNFDEDRSFDITLQGMLGIYVMGTGGYDYTQFNNKIVDKIISKTHTTFADVVEQNKIDGIRVKVNFIAPVRSPDGREAKLDWWRKFIINPNIETFIYCDGYTTTGKYWTELGKKGKYSHSIGDPLPCSIKFNTLTEANNFVQFCNNKFMTYMKNACQLDMNVPLDRFPFMQDYSQPWTDRRLCEFFDITGYISDTEAENGSEWETILNSVKQYTFNK